MSQTGEHPTTSAVEKHSLGYEIRHDIERMLHRRRSPVGTTRARAEEQAKTGASRVWGALKERPAIGVVVFGGLAVLAADAIGVGELAMGISIGYAAWKVLRKGERIDEVIEEMREGERAARR